jgi:hypothetical protein
VAGEVICGLTARQLRASKTEKQLRHEVSVLTHLIGNMRKELDAKVSSISRFMDAVLTGSHLYAPLRSPLLNATIPRCWTNSGELLLSTQTCL